MQEIYIYIYIFKSETKKKKKLLHPKMIINLIFKTVNGLHLKNNTRRFTLKTYVYNYVLQYLAKKRKKEKRKKKETNRKHFCCLARSCKALLLKWNNIKKVNFIPYRLEYTVPISAQVQITPLFRTGKNTSRIGSVSAKSGCFGR